MCNIINSPKYTFQENIHKLPKLNGYIVFTHACRRCMRIRIAYSAIGTAVNSYVLVDG